MSTAVRRTQLVAGARSVPRAAAEPAGRADERRPSLEVVAPRRRVRRRVRRRRVAPLLSAAVVSASLLFVVVGHAALAQGQVRLANIQSEITSAQLLRQREALAVAKLENPSRILGVAESTLHMTSPSQVHQLAHVPLGTRLPAPHVAASTGSTASEPASGG